MPTTRPRYSITDTGEVRELLDAAARAWPELTDRKQLLLRLAEHGRAALDERSATLEPAERRRNQRRALQRTGDLIEADLLIGDAAWR